MRDVALCVFAKPPRAGEAKTRLAPAVGAEGAADLARAFITDTWSRVTRLPWARPILASTESWPEGLLPAGVEVWQQGEGDLGARMEHILLRALEVCPAAMALGADIPGLPLAHLEAARATLEDADAVFGPSDDGGFYLLALRRLPVGAFANLPWSQPETRARTEARLKSLGLTVAHVAPFFDVDVPADLERLEVELNAGRIQAPATAAVLATLRRPER
ncbi:TIGR04282 family arsenosugar biosynthesis glycosyltransferase [Hyalangium sp.]|uniref:TIGR04282 family arsenosugar biosynthesis glycosyltransferase n=1 Tax=Hyalangium sp. TaxID=2028555 RepID=UPI002D289B1D|nr:TIGR04282 family arsenosugar biosynthesis glycosyltransferase [Hyalangium sp.]HYH97402.1 TIGR04282 family arsenosugar biosynthesis glycosyltransferase [Hyalangium sp.]